jgi:predicted anti-sigma-YlaC factor YlaD
VRVQVVLLVPFLCLGCSIRQAVVASIGKGLAGSGVFASEEDYELARQAAPFGLKTLEALHEEAPDNTDILVGLASGFTEYANAFVEQDADRIADTSAEQAHEQRARARRFYLRARRYGFHGLDVRHPGMAEALQKGSDAVLEALTKDDVPLIYWTGAAWASAAAADKTDLTLLGDLPKIEAMMKRALELDEGFEQGSIEEFFVSLDAGRPASMGGSVDRAKTHMDRALALSGGKKIGVFVTWAEDVCVQAQDKKCFGEYLDKALGFDLDSSPENRLANVVAQRRAKWLKSRTKDLFISED